MLSLGEQKISALYVGGEKIAKAYVGEDLVFSAAKPSRLPEGYTEVEYIQVSNAVESYRPYINLSAVSGAKILECGVGFEKVSLSYNTAILFGTNSSSSESTSGKKWYMLYATGSYNPSSGTAISGNHLAYISGTNSAQYHNSKIIDANQKYDVTIDFANGVFTVDDVSVSCAKSAILASNAKHLLGCLNTTNYQLAGNYVSRYGRIYYYRAKDVDGNILMDLVPCKNPSGVAGLYDTKGEKFYQSANASTNEKNAFIAGLAV